MFRYLLLPAFLLFSLSAQLFAQKGYKDKNAQKAKFYNDSTSSDLYHSNTPAQIIKPSRDFVMFGFNYVNWISKPDTVKLKPFNYNVNALLCYDFPIKKSNFSFAAGVGVTVSAMYLDQKQLSVTDTSSKLGAQARFIPDTAHFTRYKFVTAYLSSPFEIRWFSNMNNRNKGYKAALGLQISTLMGAHTKGVTSVAGTVVKEKTDTKRYLNPWIFAATMRVGYGNFTLFGSYGLTTVFKENAGPPVTPIAIGICLTGL